MAAHAREVDGLLAGYTSADPNWDGLAGSQGATERVEARANLGAPGEIALGACQTILHLNLFAIVLHLRTVASLLEADDPPADSIMVLSRTILELSARAWWLADPAISHRDRIARGILEQLRSAHENALFRSSTVGGGFGKVKTVEDVKSDTQKVSLAVTDHGKGNFKVGSHSRPNSTDLLKSFPGDDVAGPHDATFRLFSAPTHGTLYGIMLLFTGPPLDEMGKTTGTYRVTQAWLDGPTSTAVLACAWAIQRIATLLGWDQAPLNDYLRQADDLYA